MEKNTKIIVKEVTEADEKQRISRIVLEALTDWFEITKTREGYIKDSAGLMFFAAYDEDKPVGFD